MFTSGSFMNPKEIPKDIQLNILKRLIEFPSIKEIVVESRPEYITETVTRSISIHHTNPIF